MAEVRPGLTGRWSAMLDEFEANMTRRGSADTARRVVRQVAKYARECGHVSPWDATPATVSTWLDLVSSRAPTTYSYRTAIRTFYRWGFGAGYVRADPTEHVGGRMRRLPAAPAWETAILDFRRYLYAAGRLQSTVQDRTESITRLGRKVGVGDPWQVTPDELVRWFSEHRWQRETARRERQAIRDFYGWAVKAGHITTSPADMLAPIRAKAPSPRPAPEPVVHDALRAAEPRERLMVTLSAELGLRRAEVAQLHTRDVDGEAGAWWLWVRGKGDKTRRVPLSDPLAAELLDRPRGYVFPGQYNGHLSPRYVGQLVSRLLPSGVTMHALRHRFATRAYSADRDVFTLQQLLGHASPATTQRYVFVPEDNLRRMASAALVS